MSKQKQACVPPAAVVGVANVRKFAELPNYALENRAFFVFEFRRRNGTVTRRQGIVQFCLEPDIVEAVPSFENSIGIYSAAVTSNGLSLLLIAKTRDRVDRCLERATVFIRNSRRDFWWTNWRAPRSRPEVQSGRWSSG